MALTIEGSPERIPRISDRPPQTRPFGAIIVAKVDVRRQANRLSFEIRAVHVYAVGNQQCHSRQFPGIMNGVGFVLLMSAIPGNIRLSHPILLLDFRLQNNGHIAFSGHFQRIAASIGQLCGILFLGRRFSEFSAVFVIHIVRHRILVQGSGYLQPISLIDLRAILQRFLNFLMILPAVHPGHMDNEGVVGRND